MAQLPSERIQQRAGFIFPDMEKIPFEDKQKPEYNLSICKAVYTRYTGNQCDVPFTNVDENIDFLRSIAEGKQSAEQYKDFFVGGKMPSPNVMNDLDTTLDATAEASRKGWFTGYWKALSVIPNMIQRCLGEFLKNDSDIKAFCVDMDANIEETLRMNKEWVKSNPETKNILNTLRSTAGLPKQDDMEITSREALQDIKNEGGFKEKYMIGIDQAIKNTEDVSDWKLTLKEHNFKDLFTIGYAFNVLDYDYTDCKVIWKYVDPKNVINQASFKNDGSDSRLFGYYDYPSLNNIREIQDRIWNGDHYGLTDEDFQNIANNYKEYSANSNSSWTKSGSPYNSIDVTTCVMNLRWEDVEKRKESEYTNKGVTARIPYKKGHENNKAYKVIETRELKTYSCKWLVGTECVWDFGVEKNQIFVNGRPSLRFAMYRIKEESYIERLVPIAHLFAISWLKFINFMAKSQPTFVAIDIDSIAEFVDGDKKYPQDTALKMLRQQLVYFYKQKENLGGQGGDGFPIKVVTGVEQEHIMSELNTMEALLKLAEYITGLSPMTLGATPDNNLPVKTAMASLNSSNVALSYIMNAVMIMKTRLAEQTIPAISNLLEIDPKSVKYYSKVIGSDDVESIKKNRDSISSLGIKLYPRVTDKMKENFSNKLDLALQANMVDPATVLKMQYQLDHGGDFMEMVYKFEAKIKQREEQIQKDKKELVDRQSTGNLEAGKQAQQIQQETKIREMQMNDALETKKGQIQILNSDNSFINEMKKLIITDKQTKGEDPTEILADMQALINQRKEQLMQPQVR